MINLFTLGDILQFLNDLVELPGCLVPDVGLTQLIHKKHSDVTVVFNRADEQYLVQVVRFYVLLSIFVRSLASLKLRYKIHEAEFSLHVFLNIKARSMTL